MVEDPPRPIMMDLKHVLWDDPYISGVGSIQVGALEDAHQLRLTGLLWNTTGSAWKHRSLEVLGNFHITCLKDASI